MNLNLATSVLTLNSLSDFPFSESKLFLRPPPRMKKLQNTDTIRFKPRSAQTQLRFRCRATQSENRLSNFRRNKGGTTSQKNTRRLVQMPTRFTTSIWNPQLEARSNEESPPPSTPDEAMRGRFDARFVSVRLRRNVRIERKHSHRGAG